MAITGISAISGEQIIAAGAVSAREAASAAFTTGGNSLQGLYDTVSNNSGSWTGGSTYTGDAQGALDEVYSNSANWNSTYTTVSSNSATWGQGGGGVVIPYNGGDPEATYTAIAAAWDGSTPVYLSRTQNDQTYIVQVLDFFDGQGYMESYFEYASVQNYYNGQGMLRVIRGMAKYNPNYLTNQYECSWSTFDVAAASYPTYSDTGKVLTVDANGYPAWQTPQGGALPQSASDAIDVVTGGSANWNGTTETVSSNSASWGGSALPISAGPGIKLEMVNNTLVASNDETLLWSGNAGFGEMPITLSESMNNFENIEFTWIPRYNGDYGSPTRVDKLSTNSYNGKLQWTLGGFYRNAGSNWLGYVCLSANNTSTVLTHDSSFYINPATTAAPGNNLAFRVCKIVGINRIAGV